MKSLLLIVLLLSVPFAPTIAGLDNITNSSDFAKEDTIKQWLQTTKLPKRSLESLRASIATDPTWIALLTKKNDTLPSQMHNNSHQLSAPSSTHGAEISSNTTPLLDIEDIIEILRVEEFEQQKNVATNNQDLEEDGFVTIDHQDTWDTKSAHGSDDSLEIINKEDAQPPTEETRSPEPDDFLLRTVLQLFHYYLQQ
ncbi:hypothetical protein KJZ61_02850 [Candidatus Dependentiae bacterium]|nr:hypothetical protein [Candidatus Dependentiae bacterium]